VQFADLDNAPGECHADVMFRHASEGPVVRWRKRRQERAAATGDTPEKQAEDRRARETGGDVSEAAQRASTALVANSAPFNG
jgi:hypothetical protein